jgi:hypothetical protein
MRKRAKPRGKPFNREGASAAARKRWEAASAPDDPETTPYSNAQGARADGEVRDIHGLSRDTLIERLLDEKTASYALPNIVRELRALGSVDEQAVASSWRNSVQVRPDFEPPDWTGVLTVAVAQGGISVDEVVAVFRDAGRLDELRKAVGA